MPKTLELDFKLFNVRLPTGTVERIHRYRDHLNRTQPGIEASASTAARMLLFRALEQVEEENGDSQEAAENAIQGFAQEQMTYHLQTSVSESADLLDQSHRHSPPAN